MVTFTAPKNPHYEAEEITRARLLRALFGDDPSQRANGGTDARPTEFTLTWKALTAAEANALEAFFEARGGYETFDYILPHETAARTFICRDWTRRTLRPGHVTICTKFEEIFDL